MDLIRQIFLNTNREYFVLHTDLTLSLQKECDAVA